MKRRSFLFSTVFAALTPAHFACSENAAAKRTTQAVSKLEKISQERRDTLANNPNHKSINELNNMIPEIDAIEVNNHFTHPDPEGELRVIAWNTERGRHWREGVKLIQEHPALQNPDVIMLGEMDMGMARSSNEHTTREMAEALKMNYAYGVEFLEFTGGEPQERELYPGQNDWGYHGNAILSKYPLNNLRMLRFPGIETWYSHDQKRLGGRIALLAEVEIKGETALLVSTHLESARSDAPSRLREVNLLMHEIEETAPFLPTIIGGDLNADPTEPAIQTLIDIGFIVDGATNIDQGTSQKHKGDTIWLQGNCIDYIGVRNATPVPGEHSPKTIPACYPPALKGITNENGVVEYKGKHLGDHAIVTCKICLC